jgi:hypothetical protein
LIAERDPPRSERYTVRWLSRYLDSANAATIADVAFVAASLAALGGPRHVDVDDALATYLEARKAVRAAEDALDDRLREGGFFG